MNPVETITSLTRYQAPLNAFLPEEHDRWHQYAQRSVAQKQQEDHEIIAAFRLLNRHEAEVLARYALSLYDERLHIAIFLPCQLLTQIASFVDGGLQGIYSDILERGITFLPALYRGADATTRDALLKHIQTMAQDTYDFGRHVDAFAWIGDGAVQQHIMQWRTNPPPWHAFRHMNFSHFETEAGWELTVAGDRRDLYFAQAYELIAREPSHLEAPVAPLGAHCGWCGRDLEVLFDLNLTDVRLHFLDLQGSRLRIAYCPQCSWYKHLYTDIDFDGQVSWSQDNEPLQHDDDITSWQPLSLRGKTLVLGSLRRTPFELQGALFASPCSQLGGSPSWVQWATFPPCPSCTRRMMYLGQVETTDVIDQGEGVTFGFLCVECRKATTLFQQT